MDPELAAIEARLDDEDLDEDDDLDEERTAKKDLDTSLDDPPVAYEPQLYRVYVGGGGFAVGGRGVGAMGGFHKIWAGEGLVGLSGGTLVVPADPPTFIVGLPDSPVVIFCSDTGGRLDLMPKHEIHPTISLGVGYALLLPVFASGLTGFASAGAVWHVEPTMTLEGSLETRTIWFFDDPIQQVGASVGVRF